MQSIVRSGSILRGTSVLLVVGALAAAAVVLSRPAVIAEPALHNEPAGVGSSSSPVPVLSVGVKRTRDEADIRNIATARLVQMAVAAHDMGLTDSVRATSIATVTAVSWGELATLEANAAIPPSDGLDPSRVVWLVRGSGSFLGLHVPPGARPITGETGYLVIDDESGDVIGMGTP